MRGEAIVDFESVGKRCVSEEQARSILITTLGVVTSEPESLKHCFAAVSDLKNVAHENSRSRRMKHFNA
jgi:hypothetical protein